MMLTSVNIILLKGRFKEYSCTESRLSSECRSLRNGFVVVSLRSDALQEQVTRLVIRNPG